MTDDGFTYLPELEYLLQKATSSEQLPESTCNIVNFQPSHVENNNTERSRQHLQYELLRKFGDSNEFDQWWTHENNCKGWVFNTIYKKKTDDEVHVYRCAHKRCSCRIRVVFVANSCDVNVEHAIIEHVHNDSPQTYKPDSIRTLSSDVKAKISLLEKAGMTATKIRRHLFKEFQITGAPLPTLKQIQNYVGRLRFKRPSTSDTNLPQTPSAVSETSTNTGEPVKRKRGRPRLSEQRQKAEAPIQFPLFNLEQTANSSENSTKQEESEQNDSTMMTEQEILQKLSEFLCSSQQTPATLAAKKLEENPPLKHARLRLAYHFEKSFPSTESFNEWWSGPRSDSMIHNSTYMNNAAERIDIYRCSKRDCRHRVRVVINPTDNTVCVERTDMGHDISIHDAKSSLSKKAKDVITQLFETGMKPKDMLNHFLQNKVVSSDEIPTLTQIKNLCNRLKIKQKEPSPPIPTTLNDILLKLTEQSSET